MSTENPFADKKEDKGKMQFAHLGYWIYQGFIAFFHSPYKEQKGNLIFLIQYKLY